MKQAKVLTETEFKRALAVVATRRHAGRDRMALALSHFAGLRVGEMAALKWEDVVDDHGNPHDRIHLKRSYTKGGLKRTVFASRRLQREIAGYVGSLSTLPTASKPLIASQKGGHFSANSLCQTFGQIYQEAGIAGASSHSGRRGFISKLAHSGISPKVIMELVGHKHLTTTQRYIDVTDEMKQKAVNVIS